MRYLQNCPRHHLLPCRNAVASPSRRRQHHASPRRTISSPLNHPTKPSSFSPLRFASSRAEPILPLLRLIAAAASHGRRRPAPVEPPPAPLLPQNRPSSELRWPSLVLPSPLTAAQGLRNAAAGEQTRRRPLLHAGEPRPAIPASPETTRRCGSTSSPFPPT